MFQDLIEILLQKRADLRAEIEREFAARSEKIDTLLIVAGYEFPADDEAVEEAVDDIAEADEHTEEAHGDTCY